MKIRAIDQMPNLRQFIKSCNFDEKSVKLKSAFFLTYIILTFMYLESMI